MMVDLQNVWEENERTLETAFDTLEKLPGYAQAQAEIEAVTGPILEELKTSTLPAWKAIQLFDALAKPMVALVNDSRTRDAYLVLLRDSYYADAHEFLLGVRSARQARRFGGGSGRARSLRAIQALERLNMRNRFWVGQAVRNSGCPNLSAEEREAVYAEEDTQLVLFPRRLRARIKLVDSVFKTQRNQGLGIDKVTCEALQKCFDVLVEDGLENNSAATVRTLLRDILRSLLEIAVELVWLPPSAASESIQWAHPDWIVKLLEGRIAYFEAREFGQSLSQEYARPEFVVVPIPETTETSSTTESSAPTAASEGTSSGAFKMSDNSGPESSFDHAGEAKRARAATVAKLIDELNHLKPQLFEDEAEYESLKVQYKDYLTFRIAGGRPDLRQKVMSIRSSTKHILLAQELAGDHHGKAVPTIQDDWKKYKPERFKRSK